MEEPGVLLHEATSEQLVQELSGRCSSIVLGLRYKSRRPSEASGMLFSFGDPYCCIGMARHLMEIKVDHAQEDLDQGREIEG